MLTQKTHFYYVLEFVVKFLSFLIAFLLLVHCRSPIPNRIRGLFWSRLESLNIGADYFSLLLNVIELISRKCFD
jgi:hypothetical protein